MGYLKDTWLIVKHRNHGLHSADKTFWWLQHKNIGSLLGAILFYQLNQGNPRGPKFLIDLNQWLTEHKFTWPWMMRVQDCLYYWRSVSEESEHNNPLDYADKSMQPVEALHDFMATHISKEDFIVELGCNSGSNLDGLYRIGYKYLGGVEINRNAIKTFERIFPTTFSRLEVINGALEEILPAMPSKSVDVLFTMAVAMHIHPTNNWIFKEMKRIARKYIVTFEDEVSNCNYVFARNYSRLFKQIGCQTIKTSTTNFEGYKGFKLRLIRV